jgi:hypothetical protein
MPGVNQAFLTFPLTIPLRPRICPGYTKPGENRKNRRELVKSG